MSKKDFSLIEHCEVAALLELSVDLVCHAIVLVSHHTRLDDKALKELNKSYWSLTRAKSLLDDKCVRTYDDTTVYYSQFRNENKKAKIIEFLKKEKLIED